MDWVIYCCLEGMGKSKGDLMNKKIGIGIIILICCVSIVAVVATQFNHDKKNVTQNQINQTEQNNTNDTNTHSPNSVNTTQNNQKSTQATNNQKSTVNGVPYGQTEPVYGSVVY